MSSMFPCEHVRMNSVYAWTVESQPVAVCVCVCVCVCVRACVHPVLWAQGMHIRAECQVRTQNCVAHVGKVCNACMGSHCESGTMFGLYFCVCMCGPRCMLSTGTLYVCRHKSIVGDMCPVYSCVLCVVSICGGTASPQILPCSDALAPVPGAEVVPWDCASG